MNKKFSTLVATLLLSGALFTVDAAKIEVGSGSWPAKIEVASGKYVFAEDVTLSEKDCIVISEDNAIVYGNNHTLKGQLLITGKNVKVYDLNVDFTNACNSEIEDGTVPTAKSAVLLNSGGASLYNVTIVAKATDPKFLADGIGIVPTDKAAKFIISGCTITAADIASSSTTPDALKTASTGIMVWENCPASSGADNSVVLDTPVTITDTEFIGCSADYSVTRTTDQGGLEVGSVKELVVTPLYDKAGKLLNGDAIIGEGGFKYVNNDSKIIFNGSADELLEIVANVSGKDVAVECNDGNILLGNATNPENGKGAIIAGIDPLNEKVFGYELVSGETSDYCMLILHSNNAKTDFAITTDLAGVAVAEAVTESNISDYAVSEKSLWKMTRGQNNDGNYWYKFKNQAGQEMTVDSETAFFPVNNALYNNGVVFNLDGLDLKSDKPNYFGLYKAGYNKLSVEDLKWFEKDGFSVTIKHQNDKGEFKKEDIAGNPFVGHLTLMNWNATDKKFVEASSTTGNTDYDFYLMNADGNFVVAEKYIFNGAVKDQEAYTFTTVTAKALAHDIVANAKKREYYGEFQAEVSAKYKQDTYHSLKVIDLLSVKIGNSWAPVGRLDLGTKEVPTLAASIDTKLIDIQVNLGSDKVVDPQKFVQAKFFTVTKLGKDGGMLAVAGDKYEGANYRGECEFVSACGNDLEKQFALTYTDGKFVFTNRESLNYYWRIDANRLYYGEKDNEYLYGGDTYLIEAVENHEANDGYTNLSDVKNTKYHIAYSSGIFGNAWFTENHEGVDNHTIGLSTDQETALVFTATEYAKERAIKHDEDVHTDTYVPTDSIYVISELGFYDKDAKKFDLKYDTLKVVSYSFVNQYGEPLIWNGNRYVSSIVKTDAADKFALRQDNGKLNLRPVVAENGDYTSWISEGNDKSRLTHQHFGDNVKAYAGDADEEGILSQTWMYNRTENDLFTVEPTERPMYRTVINPLDTISIFRNDNPKSILFEQNGFLGMENLAQYPSIAPAMVADTAYVRDNTYRPQYMLVVAPKITPAGKWCPIHGDDPTCPDAHKVNSKGWVEGRYLVNLVDTAIAWDIANKHKDNNPYINTEKYYRLGFVQAKHIEDSLIIASTNDTLMVGTEDYNQAKFAFRYVDTDAKSFRIETANYNRLPEADEAVRDGEGYVKWMNGVVVVVDDIVDGDIFNMNEDEEGLPTANDGITASEVSVVTTDGAVIIKGAAGKTVVISNLLGQTIANAVLSSDNETISAPAGVVVVAVEGEAAVKVIVK